MGCTDFINTGRFREQERPVYRLGCFDRIVLPIFFRAIVKLFLAVCFHSIAEFEQKTYLNFVSFWSE